MHVWIIWQHTRDMISFSAYPLHDLSGLWLSTRMAFCCGQSQGAAVSSSESQLVCVISWYCIFGSHRWLIWVVPSCIHQGCAEYEKWVCTWQENLESPTYSATHWHVMVLEIVFWRPTIMASIIVSKWKPNRNVSAVPIGTLGCWTPTGPMSE